MKPLHILWCGISIDTDDISYLKRTSTGGVLQFDIGLKSGNILTAEYNDKFTCSKEYEALFSKLLHERKPKDIFTKIINLIFG